MENLQPKIVLRLVRKIQYNRGVYGELSCNELSVRTLENVDFIFPAGEYEFTMSYSPKFNAFTPLISVPHRNGIRIHAANYSHELRGCIAVGLDFCAITTKSGKEIKLLDSKKALKQVNDVCHDLQYYFRPMGKLIVEDSSVDYLPF